MTFFDNTSVEETLKQYYNTPANECFLQGERVSRDTYQRHIVLRYDPAFTMKIPLARARLARMKREEAQR